MSRTLEALFVIGCSLVGWSINPPEGPGLKEGVGYAVQMVALAQDRIAMNAERMASHIGELRLE